MHEEILLKPHNARIRPMNPADAERMRRFYESMSGESRDIFPNYPFTREHAEQAAKESATDPDKRRYVAVDGEYAPEGAMIGMVWFWGWSKRVPWLGIMIADDYQNRGLGKAMLAFAVDEARAAGKGGILLTTAKTNVRAQSLYGRFGFVTIGEDARGEYLMILNFDHE
ncbi:GNAT family N-acetyltransferase [Paenibacillus flagellatus]|nr:GNAT family N-acetyltransferase [Paenibacillus flagellatus]